MPDIYPLRNDHKHKFLDLESRITRDELIFTNFRFANNSMPRMRSFILAVRKDGWSVYR